MIRTQVSLDEVEYKLAKKEARALGISVAEFVRRAIRQTLPLPPALPGCDTPASSNPATLAPASLWTRSSMARRTECYVDTSALIAFLDRRQPSSALSQAILGPPTPDRLGAGYRRRHGWFWRRYDYIRAIQFLTFVQELPALIIQQ